MAAKIKLRGVICEIKDGVWSCQSDPLMAEALQEEHDANFARSWHYIPDIDEAGAKLAQEKSGAKIIEIRTPPADGKDLVY